MSSSISGTNVHRRLIDRFSESLNNRSGISVPFGILDEIFPATDIQIVQKYPKKLVSGILFPPPDVTAVRRLFFSGLQESSRDLPV